LWFHGARLLFPRQCMIEIVRRETGDSAHIAQIQAFTIQACRYACHHPNTRAGFSPVRTTCRNNTIRSFLADLTIRVTKKSQVSAFRRASAGFLYHGGWSVPGARCSTR